MDPISKIGDQMSIYTRIATEHRTQPLNAKQTDTEVQHANAAAPSRRAQEDAATERARHRRAEAAPRNTGGRLDTYA